MNKITQQLSLDLVEISHNIVYARQNDKLTRDLIITVTNNGYPYSIPSEAFVYLRGTRADGKSVFYQVAIDNHETGVIHADIHDYVISSAGRCKLDIGIYKRIEKGNENNADEIASTEPFILYVPKEIFDENKVVNSDEGSTLAKLINESRDKIADMNSLEADVTENEMVRETNENERQNNEAHRITAESNRNTNENTRSSNENKRQDNEAHRVTAESDRVTNENARKANEVKRQNDTNDAIERANDAAENANQKANDAKNAADNANGKANDLQNKLDSHYFALMEDLQSHNSSPTAHDDIRDLISGLTSRLNALANSDDTTLDQLSEIVAYIKSNRSLIDGITTSKINVTDIVDNLTSTANNKPLSAKQGKTLNDLITALTSVVNEKVDKVSGKGLSTNDYTTADKNKLDGIANGANAYSLPLASSGTRGGVKIGYTANGKNYPVQLNNEQMYVNVPWTDTNTNTWKQNTKDNEGYVAKGSGNGNKVWKTDENGNPGWRDVNATIADNSLRLGSIPADLFFCARSDNNKILQSTDNIDSITKNGAYWCHKVGGTKPTTDDNALLICELAGTSTASSIQRYIPFTGNYNFDSVYERYNVNGLWSSWKHVVHSGMINPRTVFSGTGIDASYERFRNSALEIRENELIGNENTDNKYAPSIGFHWSNKIAATLIMNANGAFNFLKQDGITPAPVYGDLVTKNQLGIYDTEGRLYNIIRAFGDGAGNGTQLLFGGGGNTFIGAGEAAGNLHTAFQTASNLGANETYNKGGETMYVVSDGHIYFYSNVNTAANRIGFRLSSAGNLEPVKGSSINIGSDGNSFNEGHFKKVYLGDPKNSSNFSAIFDNGTLSFVPTGTLQPYPTEISNDKIQSTGGVFYQLNVYNSVISSLRPSQNNTYKLGDSTVRWKEIWCNTSLNTSSDRNLKKDIKDLTRDDRYIKFFMLLQPKSYLFKDGESGRTHVGFISQDVENAMEECGLSSLDFAGFCKDQKKKRIPKMKEILHPANEETGEEEWTEEVEVDFDEELVFDEDGNPVYEYSLRYEEFIAMNTMMIQKLFRQNKSLEDRISALEKKVSSIL